MTDGTLLAIDVLLPSIAQGSDAKKVPCVLQQARYGRSWQLRWPLSLLVNKGQPFSLAMASLHNPLLEAGYPVLVCDLRGTGSSGGVQAFVWDKQESDDSVEVIEHIIHQPWSDGRVVLLGISAEAGAGFRTAAKQHPAVRAVAPLYMFGDLYRELFPGGIRNRLFLHAWTKVIDALDAGAFRRLSLLTSLMVRGVPPAGTKEQYMSAISGHANNIDVTAAVEAIQCIDTPVQVSTGSMHTALEFSLEETGLMKAVVDANVPLLLVSGWFDVTVTTALRSFTSYARPGWRLIIGPWNHGGIQHVRLDTATRSAKLHCLVN